ncbi:MAG TPA: hypothetical protein VIG33_04705 [Pseudobdellovibrionaceae bacterium]|jgi:hypothetical protein
MLTPARQLRNNQGMAVMEIIPIMIIIVILFNFSLGFFGAIHTGILNSMAARNYAFETFRHRSNLVYLRDGVSAEDNVSFGSQNMRIHATVSSNNKGDKTHFIATGRPIDFLAQLDTAGSKDLHNKQLYTIVDGVRFTGNNGGVTPIWVRPQYGICLNSKCGPK